MASISKRTDKNGNVVSYRIRVSAGYNVDGTKRKPFETTFKPDSGLTKKQIEKALNAFVVDFEQQCRAGLVGDARQKFQQYAEYCLELWETAGTLKASTLALYRYYLERINQGIGHLKLVDIKPQHLNQFYTQLMQNGIRQGNEKAVILPDIDVSTLLHGETVKAFAIRAGIAEKTCHFALKGKPVSVATAEKIASALGVNIKKLFSIETDSSPLAASYVRKYHLCISVILETAFKEGIIPANPATRATPPKITERKEVDTFQPQEIAQIIKAAETLPLKWKLMLHLLLASGARRGETLGLTWNAIDWNHSRIHIERAIYHTKEKGVYCDTPKSKKSIRWIALPPQTMELLKQYRDEYYEPLKAASGEKWHDTGFIFVQDSGDGMGKVMHPQSVTRFCNDFSERHGLPHIHPHRFRHTAASLLYYAGLDSISIAGMLGHSSPVVTETVYAHIIEDIHSRTASALGSVIYMSSSKQQDKPQQPADDTAAG